MAHRKCDTPKALSPTRLTTEIERRWLPTRRSRPQMRQARRAAHQATTQREITNAQTRKRIASDAKRPPTHTPRTEARTAETGTFDKGGDATVNRQSGRAVERSPQKQPAPRLAPQVCCALIERCPVGNHSVLRSARADAQVETRPRSHLWRTQAPTTARGRRVSGWHRVQPPAAPAQAALSNRGRLHAAPRCRGQAANLESSASRPVRPTVLASSLILRTTPRRACACATALSVLESSSDVVPSEFNGGKT